MPERTQPFENDESGSTSLEYGLIAAGIAVGITMAVASLGTQLKTTFASVTLSSPQAASATSGRILFPLSVTELSPAGVGPRGNLARSASAPAA